MEEENGVQLKLYLATLREKGVAPIYQSASNQIDCLEGGDEKKKKFRAPGEVKKKNIIDAAAPTMRGPFIDVGAMQKAQIE